MCPQPDLNRHTKALAIELQGHVRLAVCTAIVIICEVYRARSHRQVATLPSGTAHRSCTFATSCAAPLPNTCLNLVWITSQCLVGYAAYKKKRPAVAERFVLWPLGLEADGPSPIVIGGFQTDTRAVKLKISKFYFFREPLPFRV